MLGSKAYFSWTALWPRRLLADILAATLWNINIHYFSWLPMADILAVRLWNIYIHYFFWLLKADILAVRLQNFLIHYFAWHILVDILAAKNSNCYFHNFSWHLLEKGTRCKTLTIYIHYFSGHLLPDFLYWNIDMVVLLLSGQKSLLINQGRYVRKTLITCGCEGPPHKCHQSVWT